MYFGNFYWINDSKFILDDAILPIKGMDVIKMFHFKEKGVWPTMITPFTRDNKVDESGLEKMIEWYIGKGVDGLFAVCQSSEMFFLSLEERVKLARFVKQIAGDRIPVIASGHISDSREDQIIELRSIAETGVDAVVLVSNRLAAQNQFDEVWKENVESVLKEIPDAAFGIYECPYPYKRLISPELLKWCAETGRLYFLKDTCCTVEQMEAKTNAVKGSKLKVYNANAATLLESLKRGVSGYSGVMANFHPDLYGWLVKNWNIEPERARKLQNFLGVASLIECQVYPINAKYHMQLEGIPIQLHSRARDKNAFTGSNRKEIEQLYALERLYIDDYAK